jgi:hypothetical protein
MAHSSLAFALAWALIVSACGSDDPCGNEVLSKVEAPNGAHVAVVFERGCGATTGLSTQVSVIRRADDFRVEPAFRRPTLPGNALIIDSRNDRVSVRAQWLDDSHLVLRYAPGVTVHLAAPAVDGVLVQHVRSEARDNNKMQQTRHG